MTEQLVVWRAAPRKASGADGDAAQKRLRRFQRLQARERAKGRGKDMDLDALWDLSEKGVDWRSKLGDKHKKAKKDKKGKDKKDKKDKKGKHKKDKYSSSDDDFSSDDGDEGGGEADDERGEEDGALSLIPTPPVVTMDMRTWGELTGERNMLIHPYSQEERAAMAAIR